MTGTTDHETPPQNPTGDWLKLPGDGTGDIYLQAFDVQAVYGLGPNEHAERPLCRVQLRAGPMHAPQVFMVALSSADVIERVEAMREQLDHERNDIRERERELREAQQALGEAWGLLANVNGGDWRVQSDDWKKAALAWRNRYVMPELGDPPFIADPDEEEGAG